MKEERFQVAAILIDCYVPSENASLTALPPRPATNGTVAFRQFARLKVVLRDEALYRILIRTDNLPRLDAIRYLSNSPIDTHLIGQTLTIIF